MSWWQQRFCMVSVGLDTWQQMCWRQGLSVSGALLKVQRAANPWRPGTAQVPWTDIMEHKYLTLTSCSICLVQVSFFINGLEKVLKHCKIFAKRAVSILGRGRTNVCHRCIPPLLSAEGLWPRIPLFPACTQSLPGSVLVLCIFIVTACNCSSCF